MSSLSQFFGGGVKSIQTVNATQTLSGALTNTFNSYTWGANDRLDVTINPVDPNKTVLISDIANASISQFDASTNTRGHSYVPYTGHYAEIINSTTIRIHGPNMDFRQVDGNFSNQKDLFPTPAKIHIQVVEFN